MQDPKQAILDAINAQWTKPENAHAPVWVFDGREFLDNIATTIGASSAEDFVELMTAWHDLYRAGVIGWGYNPVLQHQSGDQFSQKNGYTLPTVHVTQRGKRVMTHLRRDPSNPAGYLAHVKDAIGPNKVAHSYLEEALQTYSAGCDKATVVLLGGAAEALVLELKDAIVSKYDAALPPKPRPKGLGQNDWMMKGIIDGIRSVLDAQKSPMKATTGSNDLHERYDYRWTALTDAIRRTRNDVGHPSDVQPVTRDDVHALLLLFPEAAKVTRELIDWVVTSFVP